MSELAAHYASMVITGFVCVCVLLQRGTGVQFPSSFKYSPNQSHANCSLLVAGHMSPFLNKYEQQIH